MRRRCGETSGRTWEGDSTAGVTKRRARRPRAAGYRRSSPRQPIGIPREGRRVGQPRLIDGPDVAFDLASGITRQEPVHERRAATMAPSASPRAFVGRERDVEELKLALDEAISGRGTVVLLAGEPGIGKTRLADELAINAELLGVQILWGNCWEGGGVPAFWPWIQVLRTLLQGHSGGSDQGESERGLPVRAAEVARLVPELAERFLDEAQERIESRSMPPGHT